MTTLNESEVFVGCLYCNRAAVYVAHEGPGGMWLSRARRRRRSCGARC
jgi:hypothetical protein